MAAHDDYLTDDSPALGDDSTAANEPGDLRPLVSPPQSLVELKQEYEGGNDIFTRKIESLEKAGWTTFWRAKGDGDCFYRAFALGYLLQIMHSPSSALQADRAQAQWETKVVPLMEGVGFEAMVYEDFLETLTDLLTLLKTSLPSQASTHLLAALQDSVVSNTLVILLRLATSALIQEHWQDYEAFLDEEGEGQDKVRRFVQREVEVCGKEADHVQIAALSQALSTPIRVAYLDRSSSAEGSEVEVDFHSFDVEGKGTEEGMTLLYRPGHYDYLSKEDVGQS